MGEPGWEIAGTVRLCGFPAGKGRSLKGKLRRRLRQGPRESKG